MDKIIRSAASAPFTASVPGSKSLTHRMLIAAALAPGESVIENALESRDTELTREGLSRMGAGIEARDGRLEISGTGGDLAPCAEPIYLENSGTSMRLLSAVAVLGKGEYTFTGSRRMCERPVGDLLNAINALGAVAEALSPEGCPPVRIRCRPITGSHVYVDCRKSSQFLSALLLISPFCPEGLAIGVSGGLVSRPYIDLTLSVMNSFGVPVYREGYDSFFVSGHERYRPGTYRVEPDASAASYFFAAGAITGNPVTVPGLSLKSAQGDAGFVKVLEKMGANVSEDKNGITVSGGSLSGVTVDMGDMPDVVPTLAVVAAFAGGTTRILNVAHLKVKESDRLGAVVHELSKMDVAAGTDGETLTIHGGRPKPAVIDTYEDHRIAMSFAVAGLKAPGTVICDPGCVAKSFPDFWENWERMYA